MVRPLPMATAKVEALSVALAQPEDDASCAGMPEPREVRAKLSMPGSRVARV
jgi:hypothetical protein